MTKARELPSWLRLAILSLACALLLSSVQAQTSTNSNSDQEKCVAALLAADISGNNQLNLDPEYITFLNEMSDNQFEFAAFSELPLSLRMNFNTYRESQGAIDISGAIRPEEATNSQKRIIETLCETTGEALETLYLPEVASQNITASVTDALDSNETISFVYPVDTVFNNEENIDEEENLTFVPDKVQEIIHAEEIDESTAASPSNFTLQVTTKAPFESNTGSIETSGTNSASVARGNDTETPSLQDETKNNAMEVLDASSLPVNLNQNQTAESNESATTVSTKNNTSASSIEAVENVTEILVYAPFYPQNSNETVFSDFTNETVDVDYADTADFESAATQDDLYGNCKLVMRYSDINEDNFMNKMEYVWFVNDNWNNPFPGVAFKNLPIELRDNFNNLAGEKGIDIAVVNSVNDMTEEQEQFLDEICASTEAALAQVEDQETSNLQEATMANFKECLMSVTKQDKNKDTFLDMNEYTSLIKNVASDKLGKEGFNQIPFVLQETFYALAGTVSIDMDGAKQDEQLTSSQQEVLDDICIEISYALEKVSDDDGPKFDGATTETMIEYAECYLGMRKYDSDDNYSLDEDEYTGLVNHLGRDGFAGLSFQNLPEIVKENFYELESDGTIDISGSNSEELPSDIEDLFLGKVCVDTTAAVNMGLVDMESSATSNKLVIHSSFKVFSEVFIPEEEFSPTGPTRKILEEAYKTFIIEVVEGLIEEDAKGTTQRKLQATVALDAASPNIYHIKNFGCNSAGQDSTCKTVFAQYEIIHGENLDPEVLYDEYVSTTQELIDSGLLQRDMEEIHPDVLVAVIGASQPVVYDGEDAFQPPTASYNAGNDTRDNVEDDDENDNSSGSQKKKIAGVAVAIAFILVAALVALLYLQRQKRLLEDCSEQNSLVQAASSQKESDTDSKEDMEEANFHEEGSSQASRRSRGSRDSGSNKSDVFRSRPSDADSDEESGTMQVVDLANQSEEEQQQVKSASSSAESSWSEEDGDESVPSKNSDNKGPLPPLWKKKNQSANESTSHSSDYMSFAFRRYALDGTKGDREEDESRMSV